MTDRKPTGGGGARHPRSLANLKPAPAAPSGNRRAMRHGGYSTAATMPVDEEVREVYDALAGSAPVRDGAGGLPAADEAAVERAARALKRWRSVTAWCDTFGRFDEKTGDVKAAARYELETERALDRGLDVLGMTPRSRAALGLDLARTADLAEAMTEADPERRARLMREAGMPIEEGPHDG